MFPRSTLLAITASDRSTVQKDIQDAGRLGSDRSGRRTPFHCTGCGYWAYASPTPRLCPMCGKVARAS